MLDFIKEIADLLKASNVPIAVMTTIMDRVERYIIHEKADAYTKGWNDGYRVAVSERW